MKSSDKRTPDGAGGQQMGSQNGSIKVAPNLCLFAADPRNEFWLVEKYGTVVHRGRALRLKCRI